MYPGHKISKIRHWSAVETRSAGWWGGVEEIKKWSMEEKNRTYVSLINNNNKKKYSCLKGDDILRLNIRVLTYCGQKEPGKKKL